MSKAVKTRIQHKHDTEVNWNQATSFIPLQGELIVYDPDDNYSYPRFKFGDGVVVDGSIVGTPVTDLPFTTNMYVQSTAPTGNLPVGSIWIDTSVVSTVQAEGAEF